MQDSLVLQAFSALSKPVSDDGSRGSGRAATGDQQCERGVPDVDCDRRGGGAARAAVHVPWGVVVRRGGRNRAGGI